jgi:hypothetical protein
MKRAQSFFVALAIVIALFGARYARGHHLSVAARSVMVRASSPLWSGRLYTPTQITRIGSLYFIVDCWHNRVLYSPSISAPIASWHVLDGTLAGPHSIASDSVLYATEDTGRNALRVYRYGNNTFQQVQTIPNLGDRTHRVRYDAATSAFYVLSANSQKITKLIRQGERLEIVYQKPLPFLQGTYTRSFTIIDGYMLFISGPRAITKVRYTDDSYEVVQTYAMPPALYEMNDLFKSGKYFYATASSKAIVRATSLEALRDSQWEDLYSKLGFHGIPYFMEEFDGRIYVPQIADYSGIQSFVANGDTIQDVRTNFDSGPPTWLDKQVSASLPK